jgi:hypothetical protein
LNKYADQSQVGAAKDYLRELKCELKKSYRTLDEAARAGARYKQSPYVCKVCHNYHLTSHRFHSWKRTRRNITT